MVPLWSVHRLKFVVVADLKYRPPDVAVLVVDVVFSYTSRQTDVTEKYFVRVDVTEEFPFLVTKLSHYYER